MKDMNDDKAKVPLPAAFEAAARPGLTIDVERYQHFLDNSGMSDAEKRDFLEALWSIIIAFVDLGFGVHPAQLACGQIAERLVVNGHAESDALGFKDTTLTELFNDAPQQE